MHFVIIPGIDNSDAEHWQSRWQAEWGSRASRIAPASWAEPERDDWCAAISRCVGEHDPAEVVLVAHSLGCLAAAHWLSTSGTRVRAAFLVSPPDSGGPNFPAAASSFKTMDAVAVQVPGLVVFSRDDPYCTTEIARRLADAWGLPHVEVGALGHINSASGLGRWDAGYALLRDLVIANG